MIDEPRITHLLERLAESNERIALCQEIRVMRELNAIDPCEKRCAVYIAAMKRISRRHEDEMAKNQNKT